MFREKLNEYMELLHCSGKEFAEYSGISEATVSRYRSGARTPKANSEDIKKLCTGFVQRQRKRKLTYRTKPCCRN